MITVGIVVGEASGDLIGSHLIQALRARHPDIRFIGIAGPKMMTAGARSYFPMEKLSVHGYVDALKRLKELMGIRRKVFKTLLKEKIDVFIGIDAPDFNLSLERKFKKKGIPAIHYVGPSIWAWRKERIHKIKKCVDHILVLFPFEPAIYEAENIPVTYVGHPLGDMLPMEVDQLKARKQLKLPQNALLVALLPGSRESEVKHHAILFVETAKMIYDREPEAHFVVPFISRSTMQHFQEVVFHMNSLMENDALPIKLMFGHSHEAMQAADAVILASGTATLEAALLKKPMVITYQMPFLNWQILKRMRLSKHIGLPNILVNERLVPELIQDEATPANITNALFNMLNDSVFLLRLKRKFSSLHQVLKQNAGEQSANVILKHIQK